jgi:hypothetical protein
MASKRAQALINHAALVLCRRSIAARAGRLNAGGTQRFLLLFHAQN